VITRPRSQALELASRLEELGAVAHVLPVIDIGPPADWGPVDRALGKLKHYGWLVFTSANGVQAFFARLKTRRLDLRALGGVKVAAIGPATAEALRGFHLEPDLMPAEYRSESLAEALRPHVVGQRVLLARADRGREVLRQELQTVANVDEIAVYAQVERDVAGSPLLAAIRQGKIDYILMTSSNIARCFIRALDAECKARIVSGQVRLVSISPVTSTAVREMGLPVAVEAATYTTEGMVEALIEAAPAAP